MLHPARGERLLSEMVAVVLAGGLGTRLRGVLPELPKPMAPVAGRPFLEWVLRYLARQGVPEAVISSGYLAQVVAAHFQHVSVGSLSVRCAAEPEPLGTGGGFLFAIQACPRRAPAWLLLNGDSLVFADLGAAAAVLDDPAVDVVVVGRWVGDTSRYGSLEVDEEGRIVAFVEKRAGQGLINAGVYLVRDRVLASFPPKRPLSLEKEVFPALTAGGWCLKVSRTDAPFLDIGTPGTLREAEAFIRQHRGRFLEA